jgi:YD repeat-containing protein
VGDNTGRLWQYTYHDGTGKGSRGDLESVTTPAVTIGQSLYASGKTHGFTYEKGGRTDPKRHKLNALFGPKKPTPLLTAEYNPDGTVLTQTFGKGPYRFDYVPAATTVTNRVNERTLYAFNPAMPPGLETLPERISQLDGSKSYTTRFGFNSQGEVTQTTTPAGAVTETVYDDTNSDPRRRGNLETIVKHPAPNLPTTVINTSHLADFQTDPPATKPTSLTWTIRYEPEFQQVKRQTDPLGRVTLSVFDYEIGGRKEGNVVEQHYPTVSVNTAGGQLQPRVAHLAYNNFGALARSADANGVVTDFRYFTKDSPGAGQEVDPMQAPSTPTGHLARTIHDGSALPSRFPTLAPPIRSEFYFRYDARGEQIEISDPLGNKLTQRFNELAQLVYRADAEGSEEEFWYDPAGDLNKKSEVVKDLRFPVGARSIPSTKIYHEFEYDDTHNMTRAVVDSKGLSLDHKWDFDAEGRQQFDRSPCSTQPLDPGDDKKVTEYRYNGRGLLEYEVRAPGVMPERFHKREYDDDGRVVKVTDSSGLFTKYEYDGWSNLVAQEDGKGNRTERTFDAIGNVSREYAHGSVDGGSGKKLLNNIYVYRDEGDREIARAEYMFRYDAAGARQTIGSGRAIHTFEHDPMGNRTAEVGPTGFRVEFGYTGRGQPWRVINSLTGLTEMTRDANGNVRKLSSPAPSG